MACRGPTVFEGIIGPHLCGGCLVLCYHVYFHSVGELAWLSWVRYDGWGHQTPNGFKIDEPLFRGANADLNPTLAISLVFFGCWFVWALQEVGIGIPERTVRAWRDGRRDAVALGVAFPGSCLEIISFFSG
jgi:hypothetical protein